MPESDRLSLTPPPLSLYTTVLLDEFINYVTREKDRIARAEAMEAEKRKIKGCLDPLTKDLVTFEDDEDLASKIDDMYLRLDEDESGGLNFEEFRLGVKQLSSNIHLTRDDFDIVTENGKHLGPTAEFDKQQFRTMMKGELWRYSRRELDNVLSVSGDEQFNSTILMLKIMESSTRSTLSEVLRLLHSICNQQGPVGEAASGEGGEGGGGKGAGGEGEIGAGEMHGLGEMLHKLSSSMDEISAKVDRQSVILEDQTAAIKRLQAPKAYPPGQTRVASPASRRSRQEAMGGALDGNESKDILGLEKRSTLQEAHSPVRQRQVKDKADSSLRTNFGAALEGKVMMDASEIVLRAKGRSQLLQMLPDFAPPVSAKSQPSRAIAGPDPKVSTRRPSRTRRSACSSDIALESTRLDAGGPSTRGGEENDKSSSSELSSPSRHAPSTEWRHLPRSGSEVMMETRPVLISGIPVEDVEGGERGGFAVRRGKISRTQSHSVR